MDFKIFESRTAHNENLSFWWILMNWIDQEWARSSGSKLWHGVYQGINYVLVYKVCNCLDHYNYLCINTKLGQVARMKRYLGDKGKRTYSLSTEFGPLLEASEVISRHIQIGSWYIKSKKDCCAFAAFILFLFVFAFVAFNKVGLKGL